MRRQQLAALIVAISVVAGCSSTTDLGATSTTPTHTATAPTTTILPAASEADAATTTAATPGGADVDATIADLASAGVTVVDDTSGVALRSVATPVSPVRTTLSQVRVIAAEAAARSGKLGSDLDAIAPAQDGVHSVSAILAAYVAGAHTAGAEVARRVMAGQDLHHPDQLVIPSLVMVLFESDVALYLLPDAGATTTVPAPSLAPAGTPAAGFRQSSRLLVPAADLRAAPCSTFATTVEQEVDDVLKALTIPAVKIGDTGSDLLNAILQAGADLVAGFLNFAIGGAVTVVVNAVKVALKPALDAIAAAAGVFAVVTEVLDLIQRWTIAVVPEVAQMQKPVSPAAGAIDPVNALVDTGGNDTWPDFLTDCAALAGAKLPDVKAIGSKVTWTVVQQPGDLVTVVDKDPAIVSGSGGGQATIRIQATSESSAVAQGAEREGIVHVHVSVRRSDIEDVRTSITDTVVAALQTQVPVLLRSVLAPAIAALKGGINDLLDQIVKVALDEYGDGEVTVVYHGPPDETTRPAHAGGAPYTMVWVADASQGPQPLPLVGGYTCSGPGGEWRMVLLPGTNGQQITTLQFDDTGGEQTAAWTATVSGQSTNDTGDVTTGSATYALTFTVREAAGAPASMTVGGTITYQSHTEGKGLAPVDIGPTTIPAIEATRGVAPMLIPGLPDVALADHPDWQHPLRTEANTAC